VRNCSNCGQPVSERTKFCPECGTSLAGRPASEGRERKVVTVLFCDLVGFTAASERADPEDVQARIGPYHSRVRSEIEHYGGTVEKFIGDAVMAAFGAPVAHEDDPERAVRAGLRILEAVADLNEGDPGLDLKVRIGINTGEAVVNLAARPEQGEGMVAGDVVNTASRLQGAAPVDGIAAGEGTYLATKEIFEYEELEPVELKGKAGRVRIWRPRAARSRFGSDVTRTLTTALVGRELERSSVTGTFERVLRDRSVHLVTIVGEPGVGKSRLVAELLAHVDALPDVWITWRQGRCLPYGDGITFWALGEVVKAHAGILESDSPEAASEKLDRMLPEGNEREWMRQRLLPLVGLEATSTADREEAFTAWRKFLEFVAESRPAVFVFEDLHWADEAMLAFLEHVTDYAEGVPMLVVCTARPELYERAPSWSASARNSNRINLGPLTEAETARLVSNLLDQTLLPAPVQSLILERAEGNPLYAEEFVRLLKDRSILVRRGSTWEIDPRAEVPLPSGVQGIIAARLDTLSPERKAMVQAAAVIGKVFWAGAVATMGGWDPPVVSEAMHELSRKELIRPSRTSSVEGEAEYSFWHILVRDVAYAQIPRADRAERHRQAAAWIEQVAGDRIEDVAEVLSHHYTQAMDLARAAGRADLAKELEASALRYLALAGERALGLDTARAEANLARALALAPDGHPMRPQILAMWAEAARNAGRYPEAAEALRGAVRAFGDQGDSLGAARAMTMLANLLWFMGDARSRQTAADAIALLEGMPSGADLVGAYAEMCRLQHLAGEYPPSIESAERALNMARDLGLGEPAKPLGYRGASRLELGDWDGLEDMRRAAEIALELGQGREAAVWANNRADATWMIEGPAASLAAYRAGIEFAELRGINELALWAAAEATNQLVKLGSWDEALSWAGRVVERLEATGGGGALIRCRCVQAHVQALRGHGARAVPLADWAVEAARDSGAIEGVAMAFTIAAMAHLANGDAEGSLGLLADLEGYEQVRRTAYFASYLPDVARTAVASGSLPLAQRLARDVDQNLPYIQHALLATEAILIEAGGETARAAHLYAQAAERWEGFGVVPERAFALLGHGRCLVTLGDSDAAAVLREARQVFASLGARPALAETDGLLEMAIALSS
jgi:class 3 adenylate cyclase/tetratricopeptide (TPR) repeat protein